MSFAYHLQLKSYFESRVRAALGTRHAPFHVLSPDVLSPVE